MNNVNSILWNVIVDFQDKHSYFSIPIENREFVVTTKFDTDTTFSQKKYYLQKIQHAFIIPKDTE